MNYLSPQIEALSKKRIKNKTSLIKKVYSCGIFQDYGAGNAKPQENRKR